MLGGGWTKGSCEGCSCSWVSSLDQHRPAVWNNPEDDTREIIAAGRGPCSTGTVVESGDNGKEVSL